MNNRKEHLIKIASRLCYSDISLPLEDCYYNKRKYFCKNSKQCEIDKLSDEQLEYIVSGIDNHSFLEACAGSGKTEVIGIKAAYEIANWQEKNSGIAILTFTKNAAKEIQDRVTKYVGCKAEFPHFIGTIDSWLHSYILHPFGHTFTGFKGNINDKSYRIIDESITADFMKNQKYKPMLQFLTKNNKNIPIYCNNYYYDSEIYDYLITLGNNKFSLQDYCNSKYFSIWIESFKEKLSSKKSDVSWLTKEYIKKNFITTKLNFIGDGFSTYQDAELIIELVLEKNKEVLKLMSRRFGQIIIDECQDLSSTQINILDYFLEENSMLHFVGDTNQSIYEFRKVDPKIVLSYIEENNFNKKMLTSNFRSNQTIVDLCSRIIKPPIEVIGNCNNSIETSFIVWSYKHDGLREIPKRFEQYLYSVDIDISKSVILGRSKSLLSYIYPIFKENLTTPHRLAIALHSWNKTIKSRKDIELALFNIGKVLSLTAFKSRYCNSRTFYTPDGEEVLVYREMLAEFLSKLSQTNWDLGDLTESKWIEELKSNIKDCWDMLPGDKCGFTGKMFRGSTTTKISDCLNIDESEPKINISTIHKVKGQTFDAVLLLSSKDKKSDGGHWSQWLDGSDEQKRLGYVASSRPKKLLIWAIPENDKEEFEKLINK